MIKQYIQQVFYSIRQQKLLSGITIAATALTICLVMVILLLQQINVVPFAPESNRRKMLFVSQLNSKQNGSDVIAPMDQRVAEALFQTLQKPARVTLYEQQKSMPVKSLLDEGELSQTVLKVDDNFFHVFDLKFLSGGKFDKAQFESGAHVAIIAKQLSMFLFDTIESEGMQFEISDELYRVVGVVSDVSPLAYNAYAHVWIPYTSIASETSMFKHHGRFCATLLLNNLSDVNDVQKEVADALAGYNKQISPDTLLLRGQPEG
ncbi:MAG: ABC transporter permease, partial [Tannerellaceae bacterium]